MTENMRDPTKRFIIMDLFHNADTSIPQENDVVWIPSNNPPKESWERYLIKGVNDKIMWAYYIKDYIKDGESPWTTPVQHAELKVDFWAHDLRK